VVVWGRAAMSILGLGEYDSPTAAEDSPQTGEVLSEVLGAPSALELSIVDYENDPEEKADATDASLLGVTLDDETVHRVAPRRVGVGGVQISVTKKPTARGAASAAALDAAESPAAAESAEDVEERAAFVIPSSPTSDVEPKLAEKFMSLVAKTHEGYSVNEHIRNAKSFRNPDILEKLVAFFDVRECGTNYPKALYDPNDVSKDEYYERLEELRRKWEERQARKPADKTVPSLGGLVDTSKAVAPIAGSSAAVAAIGPAAAKPRKSKWDTSGGSSAAEPPAKRVAE